MEPTDFLIGVLLPGGYLKTDSEEILLTNIQMETAVSPEAEALNIQPEDINKAAVVCGSLSGEVLYSAKIVEILSLLSSGLLNSLIKKEILTFDDIQKQVIKIEASQKEQMIDKKLCALVIGHKKASPGAVNPATALSEFVFNDDMANRIEEKVKKTNVQKVYREKTYRELPGDINMLDPDFIVSLHCNSFNGKASGTEVLFYHKSKKGEEMAGILIRHLVDYLRLPNRGIKPRSVEDRGGHLLRYTNAPCVIAEPFFIDNDEDLAVAQNDIDGFANIYARAIDEISLEVV